MIRYEYKLPNVDEYLALYQSVGWGTRDKKSVLEAIGHSIMGICVYDDDKIIGMARVIGDKSIFLYIQDVAVDVSYQKKGIGKELMIRLIKELYHYQKDYPDIRIYLGASKGKEEFYEKVGFIRRSDAGLGEGMILKE